MADGGSHPLSLSLRNRVLLVGILFFLALFATAGIALVQTAQHLRDAQPIAALAVSRHPLELEQILEKSGSYDLKSSAWHAEWAWWPRATLFPSNQTSDVFIFDGVPADAVETEELTRLAAVAENDPVGLVFFAGELFAGNGNRTSWTNSAIGRLLPVELDGDAARIKGDGVTITTIGKDLTPLPGLCLSELPPVREFTRLKAKPNANVTVSAMGARGETYPLLVWWEAGDARVVVWAGSLDEFCNWRTEDFFDDSGMENGPSLVQRIIRFAAEGWAAEGC